MNNISVTPSYPSVNWQKIFFALYCYSQIKNISESKEQTFIRLEARRDGGFVMELTDATGKERLHYYHAVRYQTFQRFTSKILFDERFDDLNSLVDEYQFHYRIFPPKAKTNHALLTSNERSIIQSSIDCDSLDYSCASPSRKAMMARLISRNLMYRPFGDQWVAATEAGKSALRGENGAIK